MRTFCYLLLVFSFICYLSVSAMGSLCLICYLLFLAASTYSWSFHHLLFVAAVVPFLHDCLPLLSLCKLVKLQQVLRDNESRKEYDYMLDHPEEMFGNYYRSSVTKSIN